MMDFFISYTHADRPWAVWLAWQLEEAGYTTLLDVWDMRPGANFILAMQQATVQAERTLLVLSPDYLSALFPQPEWAAALAHDPTGIQGTLLPVRVRECTPPGMLHPLLYIDLVGLDEATARDTLLAGVRRERAKPTTAPGWTRPYTAGCLTPWCLS
jgi:TIR domain